MKVKVRWRNKNPFADMNNLTRVSDAEISDNTEYNQIEKFAKEATPVGFFLINIELPNKTYQYDSNGNIVE